MANRKEIIEIEESCGNVYKDLGLPDADEMLAKSRLAIEIGKILKKRRLTQVKAAKILGIAQARISEIITGKLRSYSYERLFHFLLTLGFDIEIKVSQHTKRTTTPSLQVTAHSTPRRQNRLAA